MDGESERLPIKTLVVGDSFTGKTSVIKKFVHDTFRFKYKASSGVAFSLKELIMDEETVRLQLWDVAGAESTIGTIASVYYKDAFGAMLVYDVTRPSTFDTVLKWKAEIDSKVTLPNGEPLPVVLLGNKYDIETAAADTNELDKFCAQHGFIAWYDISAKTGFNIDEAARCLVEKILTYDDIFESKLRETVKFRPGAAFDKESGTCY